MARVMSLTETWDNHLKWRLRFRTFVNLVGECVHYHYPPMDSMEEWWDEEGSYCTLPWDVYEPNYRHHTLDYVWNEYLRPEKIDYHLDDMIEVW